MLLDSLTAEEQGLLAGICTVKTYVQDAVVLHEGERDDSLLLVRKGRVEIRKRLDGGEYKILATLGPGELFGEIAFLNGTARSATAVATQPVEILYLTKNSLEKLASDHPVVGLKVYRSIAEVTAARLVANTEALRKAVLWAIEGMHVV